jgi:hypothetical protein
MEDSRFIGETTEEVKTPQCNKCIHYRPGKMQCAAFERIPDAIWRNEHDHTRPYPGDNGIQFEPMES